MLRHVQNVCDDTGDPVEFHHPVREVEFYCCKKAQGANKKVLNGHS